MRSCDVSPFAALLISESSPAGRVEVGISSSSSNPLKRLTAAPRARASLIFGREASISSVRSASMASLTGVEAWLVLL